MIKLYSLLLALITGILVNGQCINTFPYVQDFETSQGGWVSGGILITTGHGAHQTNRLLRLPEVAPNAG